MSDSPYYAEPVAMARFWGTLLAEAGLSIPSNRLFCLFRGREGVFENWDRRSAGQQSQPERMQDGVFGLGPCLTPGAAKQVFSVVQSESPGGRAELGMGCLTRIVRRDTRSFPLIF